MLAVPDAEYKRAPPRCGMAAGSFGVHWSVAAPSGRYVAPGEWGPGRPSFYCVEESSAPEKTVLYVPESDAEKMLDEHPYCAGAKLVALGGSSRGRSAQVARLVTIRPPAAAVISARKRGSERFVSERIELTEAGVSDFNRGVRLNLILRSIGFYCKGVNTFVCGPKDVDIFASADASSARTGSVAAGTTVLALEQTHVANRGVWIRLDRGWACSTTPAPVVATLLKPAGCVRQCGGVCACASSCTNQVKARHGCNFRILFESTLLLAHFRRRRVVILGRHTASSSTWAPIPIELRPMSKVVKQKIKQEVARNSTAKTTQLLLNAEARKHQPATSINSRGACLDRSAVPSL